MIDKIKSTADFLMKKIGHASEVGIILGSGLGKLAERIERIFLSLTSNFNFLAYAFALDSSVNVFNLLCLFLSVPTGIYLLLLVCNLFTIIKEVKNNSIYSLRLILLLHNV